MKEHPEFAHKLVELLSSANESNQLKAYAILAMNNILTPDISLSSQLVSMGVIKPITQMLATGIEAGDKILQERCTLALALFSKIGTSTVQ